MVKPGLEITDGHERVDSCEIISLHESYHTLIEKSAVLIENLEVMAPYGTRLGAGKSEI